MIYFVQLDSGAIKIGMTEAIRRCWLAEQEPKNGKKAK